MQSFVLTEKACLGCLDVGSVSLTLTSQTALVSVEDNWGTVDSLVFRNNFYFDPSLDLRLEIIIGEVVEKE